LEPNITKPARAANQPATEEEQAKPSPVTTVHEEEIEAHRSYRLTQVKIQPETNQPANNKELLIEYYQSKKKTGPVILLLPIAGGGYEVEHHFARYFARHGFTVVLARRFKEKEPGLAELTAINQWLLRGVADNKRVLDWIMTRPELASRPIGLFGISMGAIKGVMLMAEDPRIKVGVLGLVGGDLPYILAHSSEPGISRRREAYLRERNITSEQLQEELNKVLTCEPNTAAPNIDPQKVLLVLGVFDSVVPFKKGWQLRKCMGRPETILLPTGHYSTVAYIFYVRHQSLKFFREHFRK
jgi:hypothetical protein